MKANPGMIIVSPAGSAVPRWLTSLLCATASSFTVPFVSQSKEGESSSPQLPACHRTDLESSVRLGSAHSGAVGHVF